MILSMKHFAWMLVAVLGAGMAVADEAKPAGPRTPAAQTAIAKHEKTLNDAAQVYQATKTKADQELVTTLKKVQGDVMKAGGSAALAESNAIQAVIDKTGNVAPTSDNLAAKISAKKWSFKGTKTILTYHENGTAECTGWGGKPGTWSQTGPNTIEQHEPNGNVIDITFDPELRGSVWVYRSGEVTFASPQ